MRSDNYNLICDDFYLDMYVNTEMNLPRQRDTILGFFERLQKQFPSMGCFYQRGSNEYCLEEGRNTDQYRWVCLETDRIGSGIVNPSSIEDAYSQDRLVLELIPYMLSVSHLDVNSLDVTFAMDFDCAGSHDEVIAEAFLAQSAFGCLLESPSARVISFSPTIAVALSDDCCTQGRIDIESKTGPCQLRRKEQVADETIGLSFTIRQYPRSGERFDALKSFENQCRLIEKLMAERIIPDLVQPLTETIAQKRLM